MQTCLLRIPSKQGSYSINRLGIGRKRLKQPRVGYEIKELTSLSLVPSTAEKKNDLRAASKGHEEANMETNHSKT